jgi:tetratricopeptide (TPR) repeat protein
MSECHPDRATLEKFLDDQLPVHESLALQRHLFSCPTCEEGLIELLPGLKGEEFFCAEALFAPSAPFAPFEYHGLVRQVLAETEKEVEERRASLSRERAGAYVLWEEIESLDCEAIGRLVAGDPRFHTWGFFELVVDKARRAVLMEPRRAEAQLHLALEVTDRLDPVAYGPGLVEAARARAYGYLGNTWRVLSDFRRAEQAFAQAERHLAQSWMDPLDEALLLELEGSLRRAQQRFDEALALLDGALTLYREINEPHLQGRTLMTKGLVLQYTGEFRGAISCFNDSLFLLDGAEDPRLVVACQFNLINCLFDSGRTLEAANLIADARQLMEKTGTRSDLLRLRWLEARALAVLGQVKEAEQALLEVRDAFTADQIAFDAALVSLHLAALYSRDGRTAEAQRMALEMIPIFQSCEVHQEALAAVIVLQKAAEMEQLTLGLVEEVSAFLERVRANPANAGLRFREEG